MAKLNELELEADVYCPHCGLKMRHGRKGYAYCPDNIYCEWEYDITAASSKGSEKPISKEEAQLVRMARYGC